MKNKAKAEVKVEVKVKVWKKPIPLSVLSLTLASTLSCDYLNDLMTRFFHSRRNASGLLRLDEGRFHLFHRRQQVVIGSLLDQNAF